MAVVLQRALRLLAVLAISLIVPIQGMASVTSGQCMSLGHHEPGTAAGAHAHGEPAPVDEGHESHSHADGDAAKQHGETKNSHCGPCTACCASASIAGPLPQNNMPAPASATYSFSQFPPLGVQPSELDRPPLAL